MVSTHQNLKTMLETTILVSVPTRQEASCLQNESFTQKLQVPKMGKLSLIKPYWGWVFPYISLIYSLHRFSYLHFRYLKFFGECYLPEISNKTHWTDPEKTWVSNSLIATYRTGSAGKVPFNVWWIIFQIPFQALWGGFFHRFATGL